MTCEGICSIRNLISILGTTAREVGVTFWQKEVLSQSEWNGRFNISFSPPWGLMTTIEGWVNFTQELRYNLIWGQNLGVQASRGEDPIPFLYVSPCISCFPRSAYADENGLKNEFWYYEAAWLQESLSQRTFRVWAHTWNSICGSKIRIRWQLKSQVLGDYTPIYFPQAHLEHRTPQGRYHCRPWRKFTTVWPWAMERRANDRLSPCQRISCDTWKA